MVADGSGSQSGLLDGRLVFISFVLLFAHMSLWYVLGQFFTIIRCVLFAHVCFPLFLGNACKKCFDTQKRSFKLLINIVLNLINFFAL